MSGFAGWSQQAGRKPVHWPERKPVTRISVRLIPGFFGEHAVNIEPGDPHANIALNHADIRFPDPFDGDRPTTACREFIADAVRQAVRRDHHKRWISWPDGGLTFFTPEDSTPIFQPPSANALP